MLILTAVNNPILKTNRLTFTINRIRKYLFHLLVIERASMFLIPDITLKLLLSKDCKRKLSPRKILNFVELTHLLLEDRDKYLAISKTYHQLKGELVSGVQFARLIRQLLIQILNIELEVFNTANQDQLHRLSLTQECVVNRLTHPSSQELKPKILLLLVDADLFLIVSVEEGQALRDLVLTPVSSKCALELLTTTTWT